MGKCAPLKDPNTTIFEVDDEEELIRMIAAIFRYRDPEIILTFNGQGFDYDYLDKRLQRMMLDWPVMGRLKGEKSYVKDKGWSSKAH